MAGHRFTWLDVFSGERFQGNGLAVIHDADDIDDATMHRIARETRLSETSFIQSPAADGADYRHRIWMMTGEIPFACHASLGTAAAVARARGETQATYVQETKPGLQVIDVEGDGERARVSMLQEPPQFGDELDPGDVLPLVGLEEDDAAGAAAGTLMAHAAARAGVERLEIVQGVEMGRPGLLRTAVEGDRVRVC